MLRIPARHAAIARRSFLTALLYGLAALASFSFSLSGPATAAAVKQVKLTEQQVQNYLAAYKDMSQLIDKVEDGNVEKADAKLRAELEAGAKKFGFASYAE